MKTSEPIEPSTPDLAETAAVAVVEKHRGPICTTVLPLSVVSNDIEVREAFLGSDLESICAIAASTASVVLITTAGQGLEQREAAFSIWRKRSLESLAATVPDIYVVLAKSETLQAEFNEGTIDLLNLDRLVHDIREEACRKRAEFLVTSKQNLRDAVAKHTFDNEAGLFPRFCVIRADGEMRLYRSRGSAVEFGREGNLGYHLIPLDTVSRNFVPADPDAAA